MKHIEAWRLRDEAYRGVLSSWARGWKALVAHLWAAVGGTSPLLHNMNNKSTKEPDLWAAVGGTSPRPHNMNNKSTQEPDLWAAVGGTSPRPRMEPAGKDTRRHRLRHTESVHFIRTRPRMEPAGRPRHRPRHAFGGQSMSASIHQYTSRHEYGCQYTSVHMQA